MECPFCAESVQEEAIVCKHCSRDLSVTHPVMRRVPTSVPDIDTSGREREQRERGGGGKTKVGAVAGRGRIFEGSKDSGELLVENLLHVSDFLLDFALCFLGGATRFEIRVAQHLASFFLHRADCFLRGSCCFVICA